MPSTKTDDDLSATKNTHKTTTMALERESEQDHAANETSPLLQTSQAPHRHDLDLHPRHHKLSKPSSVFTLLLLVVLLVSFGEQLTESPTTRLYESVICYKYYEVHDPTKLNAPRSRIGPGAIGGVDELFCKVDAVQDELAMLNGIATFLDGFPSLLLAIPFGWAADRFGRWAIVMMNLVQFVGKIGWTQMVAWNWQVFDIRTVWLQAGFSIFGGGSPVVSAMVFVIASDVVEESERAGAFLRLGAANMCASLFMPPVAAMLMEKSPWIPAFLGMGFFVLGAVLWLFVPETMDYLKRIKKSPTAPAAHEEEATPAPPPELSPANPPINANLAARWTTNVKSTLLFLTRDWRVPALIPSFAIHMVIASASRLLLQYTSKRYNLTFSKATLILTIRNAVQVALLFTIMPYISKLVMRVYGLSNQKKDLYLARGSQIILAVGWLCVGAAPNVPLSIISLATTSLGVGAPLMIRSFLTSIIPPHEVARTYSVISMVDTVGIMLGAPLLAELFKRGMEIGGGMIGLPFYSIGLVCTFFACMMFVVGLRKGEGETQSG